MKLGENATGVRWATMSAEVFVNTVVLSVGLSLQKYKVFSRNACTMIVGLRFSSSRPKQVLYLVL